MGKGSIISGGEDGQYQVSVIYNTGHVESEKAANLAKIDEINAQILEETDDSKISILKLQKMSIEKRNETLANIPDSKEITAWCADLTKDLTGDIGLIEVPGESVEFNIQPGFEGNANYIQSRDGQLKPTMGMSAASVFYNLAMLPGWQKWMPTYRYAIIENIDRTLQTADIELDSAASSQMSLNVNAHDNYTNVPIEYMTCNSGAFNIGDNVLVEFIGQDKDTPRIIGFKENPKPCGGYLLIECYDSSEYVYTEDYDCEHFHEYYVYDFDLKGPAEDIPADESGENFLSFPCSWDEISYWISITEELNTETEITSVGTDLSGYGTETLEFGDEIFINSKSMSETGNRDGTELDYYGDIYFSSVGDFIDKTEDYDFELYDGKYCGGCVSGISYDYYAVTHNGSNSDCFYDITHDSEKTFTFKTKFIEHVLLNLYYELGIVGNGGDESFTTCNHDFSYLAHTIVGSFWVFLDPIHDTHKIETNSSLVLVNHISWNTYSKTANVSPRPPYSDVCADLGEHCNSIDNPPAHGDFDTWDDFLDVRVSHNPGGLGEIDYATIEEEENLKSYIRSVYDKYRTNGFPSNAVTGPTFRVKWEFSIRN